MKSIVTIFLFGALGFFAGVLYAFRLDNPISGFFALVIIAPLGSAIGIGIGYLVAWKLWG